MWCLPQITRSRWYRTDAFGAKFVPLGTKFGSVFFEDVVFLGCVCPQGEKGCMRRFRGSSSEFVISSPRYVQGAQVRSDVSLVKVNKRVARQPIRPMSANERAKLRSTCPSADLPRPVAPSRVTGRLSCRFCRLLPLTNSASCTLGKASHIKLIASFPDFCPHRQACIRRLRKTYCRGMWLPTSVLSLPH